MGTSKKSESASFAIIEKEKRVSCKDCAEIRALHILIDERLDSYDKSQTSAEKNARFRTWAVGIIVSSLLTLNLFVLGAIHKKISAIDSNNYIYQQFMFQNLDIDTKLDWMIVQQQRLFHGLNKIESAHPNLDKTLFPDYLGNVL